MSSHQKGCAVSEENSPVLKTVEIAFQHLCEKHKDMFTLEREPHTKKGKCIPDATVGTNQMGNAIFVLRNWLDELDKFEKDREKDNGRHRPNYSSSKRHLHSDKDCDGVLNGESRENLTTHDDIPLKKSKSGTLAVRKDETPFACSAGFLVLVF